MAKNIPFFDMFAELQVSGDLRLKLAGAELTGASIDQSCMSISLYLVVENPLEERDVAALRQAICAVYGFGNTDIFVTTLAPEPAPKPAETSASAGGEKKDKSGKVIMGNPIKAKAVPIKELNLKMGTATVEGKVFFYECQETRRPGTWRLTFDMTDYTNSVSIMKFLTTKEAQQIQGAIKPGMWLAVQGKMELTRDGKDVQLNPYHISAIDHKERMDTAPVKRVELHLHTKMSNMDALTDTKEVIKQAISWGHPAIAITDHGVASSFPDAWHASGDKIKVLYGVEGYFVNNVDDRIVVHGKQDQSIDDEIVCFDIETTGLKVDRETITEIGAVVLKNGEITEKFQTFVNPKRRLTPEIIGLTGITDEISKMLRN